MATMKTLDRFTPQELREIATLLVERRRLLASDLAALEEDQAWETSSVSGAATNLAESGSDLAATDINLGTRMALSLEIRDIDEALQRMREGTFGRCESCGQAISQARLEAIPYARLCLGCRKEEEDAD